MSGLRIYLKCREDQMSVGTLIKAAQSILSLLREIEVVFAQGNRTGLNWIVKEAQTGNSLTMTYGGVALEPLPYTDRDITLASVDGLVAISKTGQRPARFSDQAVNFALQLASLVGRPVEIMRLSTDGNSADITSETSKRLSALMDTGSRELSTVEGRLKMVSIARKWVCNIYDSVTGLPVAVEFDKQLLPTVRAAIGQRVSVSGLVHYAVDGYPKRVVDVSEIDIIPDDIDLPTAADLLKMNLDLTGGLTVEEFMEKRHERE